MKVEFTAEEVEKLLDLVNNELDTKTLPPNTYEVLKSSRAKLTDATIGIPAGFRAGQTWRDPEGKFWQLHSVGPKQLVLTRPSETPGKELRRTVAPSEMTPVVSGWKLQAY